MAAVRAARAAGSPKLLLLIIAVLLPAFARAVQFPGVQVPFSWNFVPPTAAPGYEDGDLIEFHGFNCDHCEEMEPLMNRVEKELNVKFKRYMVWAKTKEYELFRMLDMEYECAGLPLFYNRRTREIICGATTYDNFYKWASSIPSIPFLAPGWGVADKYKMKECEKFQVAMEPEARPPPYQNIVDGFNGAKERVGRTILDLKQSLAPKPKVPQESVKVFQRALRRAKQQGVPLQLKKQR